MGLYDYKNYSDSEAVERLALAKNLAVSASVPSTAEGSSGSETALPAGWRNVSATELGLDPALVDSQGFIKFMSPLTGWAETGPQLKVLAQTDASGQIIGLAVCFSGTNSMLDVLDYLQMNADALVPSMAPVLEAVRDLALANGLDGQDVTITGYSLGGGMTNIMSRHADTLIDGFFADSDYYGFASPVIHESDRILNVGFENDVVHRATGDSHSFWQAVAQADPALSNPDREFSTSTDNFVLFDDTYAAAEITLGVDSLLNPLAWLAHIEGASGDAIERAGASRFYHLMDQDSTVIVSGLGADLREHVWVRDKAAPTSDHFGSAGFVIGSEAGDRLADSAANDWLEGLGGDDTIRVSSGLNVVDGGAGHDTLRLTGTPSDYTVFALSDGSLAFASASGLTLASNIEDVEFAGGPLGLETIRAYEIAEKGLVDSHWWLLWGRQDLAFQAGVEGTNGVDTLTGRAVFGQGGANVITGTGSTDLLHGGAGADHIKGGAGADRLYGGDDADRLVADSHGDRLNGGHGNDVFVFDAATRGTVHVEDFNAAAGDADLLYFLNGVAEAALASARQFGEDTIITHGRLTIVLDGVDVDSLGRDELLVA
ncbi:hypothetical protein [Paracoccus zhejiangensis]|uniref:Triacylglycerol lipase n=1 Tax=Paracoccus zhejiangensis TaxID=1077935 RepID=A0A2H5EZ36_9RHOB|nr:hypothetical protein [Paracoccus zhejiangensis]AUH64543.1 hypothetical protein CX676_10525 [Paracoccus zhejiangensis]